MSTTRPTQGTSTRARTRPFGRLPGSTPSRAEGAKSTAGCPSGAAVTSKTAAYAMNRPCAEREALPAASRSPCVRAVRTTA
ncbi:hypothetical protein AB0L10_42250, partial [Streptomyces flaveolus]|uniref:hypothetical protein n=1 Tax=Streptomyces flaveolus TaxID=67297 RepID=UPI00343B6C5F